MTKPKTYWAVFTGRGFIAMSDTGLPCVFYTKTRAEDYSLWWEQHTNHKGTTVRKVKIVEVGK